jgi:hypothetical protein
MGPAGEWAQASSPLHTAPLSDNTRPGPRGPRMQVWSCRPGLAIMRTPGQRRSARQQEKRGLGELKESGLGELNDACVTLQGVG